MAITQRRPEPVFKLRPKSSRKTARAGGARGSIDEGLLRRGTDTYAETALALEDVALAAGVVELREGVSYSARNLKQLRKSLLGQAEYVRLVHPVLTDSPTEDLMRRVGAREWSKGVER